MGRHGSDLALVTADMVVVRDELGTLAAAIDLSGRACRAVIANLGFAAAVVTALVCVGLVVGLNGLRLLRRRHWRP